MTDDNDSLLDGLTDDSSRRSFMKKGALTSVGFALGAAGSGTALGQEDGDTDTGTTGGQAGGAQAFMLLNQVVPGAQFTVDSGELDWSPVDGDGGQTATHVVQYEFSEYAFLFVPSGVDASEGDQFTIESIENVTQSLQGDMQAGGTDGGLTDGNETGGLGENDTGGMGEDNDTGGGLLGGNDTEAGQMEPATGQTSQQYFVAVQLSSADTGMVGDDTGGLGDNETDGNLTEDNETGGLGQNDTGGISEDTEPGQDNDTDGGLLGGNESGNDTENDTGGGLFGGNESGNESGNDTGL